jgi:hypothetical protein
MQLNARAEEANLQIILQKALRVSCLRTHLESYSEQIGARLAEQGYTVLQHLLQLVGVRMRGLVCIGKVPEGGLLIKKLTATTMSATPPRATNIPGLHGDRRVIPARGERDMNWHGGMCDRCAPDKQQQQQQPTSENTARRAHSGKIKCPATRS